MTAKVQQALLYILTAFVLLTSTYLLHSWLRELTTTTSVILLVVPVATAVILLFSGILTFFNRELARTLALIAACASGLFYLFRVCAALLWVSVLIFYPQPFLALLLPTLLLWLTIRYSRHGTTTHETTVWRWLWSSGSTSILLKAVVVVSVLLLVAFVGLEVIVLDTTTTHQMRWETSSDRHCLHRITLTFQDAPAYHIDICSRSLWEHLQSVESDNVNMQLHADYVWGTWEYTIQRVGSWHGAYAPVPRFYLSCSSGDPECEDSEFPLSDPHSFRSAR